MSATLKILYLLHDSRRSGVPAVISCLIRSLDRSRVTPIVLFAYDGIYAAELRAQGVEVITFSKRWPFFWRLSRFLFNWHLFKLAKQIEIVHINSVKLSLSVIVARLLGLRVVFHIHEKPGKFGKVLIKAMGMADCVLFCAQNGATHFEQVPVRSKRVILNAVNVPEHVAKKEVRPLRLVMLGSINRNKGQDLLLQAFSLLGKKDVELHLYGTVGLSAHIFVWNLKRYVRRHHLEGKVFFPGPTNDSGEVFRQADILVHGSLSECMSISILEALSWGLPVIANDIAGMDEIIRDGVNGYLVKTGDIGMLAERISFLLNNPDHRKQVGHAGRKMIVQEFNMSKRADEFLRLYEELRRG